jgi:hypothetical protein
VIKIFLVQGSMVASKCVFSSSKETDNFLTFQSLPDQAYPQVFAKGELLNNNDRITKKNSRTLDTENVS